MKTLLRLSLFLLIATGAKATEEEDRKALREIAATYEKAMASGDLEPLRPCITPDFKGVMLDGSEVSGYDGLLAFWAKANGFLGKGGSYRVTVDPQPTTFLSDSLGLASGSSRDHAVLGSGKAMDFTTRWSALVKRDGSSWKVAHLQITMDPINNPFALYAAGTMKWVHGGTGLVAGLLLGVILRGLRKKTPATSA